jgi:hypothetical protein
VSLNHGLDRFREAHLRKEIVMSIFRRVPLALLLLVFCPLSLAGQITKGTGVVKVCKVAGFGVPAGTLVHFTVGSSSLNVPAGPAPGGLCAVSPPFPTGTTVTVTETIPLGDFISGIDVNSPGQLVGNANLATGVVNVKIIFNGVTEVTYTNRRKMDPTGFLEICKQGHAKGNFSFTVNPGNLGPFVVPAGACSPPIEVVAGTVTITETPAVGYTLVNCATFPSGRQISCNPSTLTSTVHVVAGNISSQTIAIMTNGPKIPPPHSGSKPQ